MSENQESVEVQCPCCLGQGEVIGPEGKRLCPICESYLTVPKEVHDRFLEVAARRIAQGDAA